MANLIALEHAKRRTGGGFTPRVRGLKAPLLTGPELRHLRRRRGWKQWQLAIQVGVTEQCVYLWESQRTRIPDHVAGPLRRLLRATARV